MNPYVGGGLAQGGLNILGGMFGRRSQKKAQQQQMIAQNLHAIVQRQWAQTDRANQRRYSEQWRYNERRHAAGWRENDRRYSEAVRDDERRYSERFRNDERHYAERWRKNERVHAKNTMHEQRAYDRGHFQRLRDDAAAAGFNPLSVLGLGGGGTTAGGVTMQAPVFAPGGGSQGGGFGPPTMAPPMSDMGVSGVNLPAPPLSSRNYVTEALSDVVGTWFNRDQLARDDELQALQLAIHHAELQEIQDSRETPSGYFGYDIPTVVSSSDSGSSRSAAPELSPIPRHFSDRPHDIEPEKNLPALSTVTFPDGITSTGFSSDAFESEIFQTFSDVVKGLAYGKRAWDKYVLRPFYDSLPGWSWPDPGTRSPMTGLAR